MTPRDMFGTEIKEGDQIIYPGRAGSSLWMNHARVLGFTMGGPVRPMRVQRLSEPTWRDGKYAREPVTNGSISTLTVFDRVVLLANCRLEVLKANGEACDKSSSSAPVGT